MDNVDAAPDDDLVVETTNPDLLVPGHAPVAASGLSQEALLLWQCATCTHNFFATQRDFLSGVGLCQPCRTLLATIVIPAYVAADGDEAQLVRQLSPTAHAVFAIIAAQLKDYFCPLQSVNSNVIVALVNNVADRLGLLHGVPAQDTLTFLGLQVGDCYFGHPHLVQVPRGQEAIFAADVSASVVPHINMAHATATSTMCPNFLQLLHAQELWPPVISPEHVRLHFTD